VTEAITGTATGRVVDHGTPAFASAAACCAEVV
jgi:hypothetical protein